MKKISLLRHAKSSWRNPETGDFDRPLNARGFQAAPLIARYMTEHRIEPDAVLCSPALRTRQTLEIIIRNIKRPKKVCFLKELYMASAETILELIHALSNEYEHVLIIGHNPGLEMLAGRLADQKKSDPKALEAMQRKFPTAALARFEFPVQSWEDICIGTGRLVSCMTPKALERA